MRITMKNSKTIADYFEEFIIARKAKGLCEKTLKSYSSHFKCIAQHLDVNIQMEDLKKSHLEQMISNMRTLELSATTISSYVRVLKTFLSWCNEEKITSLNLPRYKCEETIKETYTDNELKKLIKKPDMHTCNFPEYRTWVIINLLLNNGCRSATIRNIQMRDVDLHNHIIYLRHTKNKKSQVIPLCSELCVILKEYMRIRSGNEEDYLFPSESGTQLSENALKCSISRYNKRRGVSKTSVHSFRHTFARKYLVDCGGNAFTLQRLLGHSTLDMTKHYCAIFDTDIVKNYDNFSPLSQMKSKSKIKMDR